MQLVSFPRLLLFTTFCSLFGICAADPIKGKKMFDSNKTAASPKIAVVNVHKIITVDPEALPQASKQWRNLYEKLQDTLKTANREIEDLESKYKKKIEEIETLKKTGVASKDTLQKKYGEEIAPLEYQLQNQYQQRERFAQQELEKAQKIIAPILKRVIKELKKVAGWNMIAKGDAFIDDIDEQFDVTNEVLNAMNKLYEEELAEKAKKSASQSQTQKA